MDTSRHPATRPLRPRWEAQSRLLLDLALTDLESGTDVLPTMVAFRGDDPLFLATLRPFPRGGHHDPVIEVGALAVLLGADRVMVSLAGRAWSTVDPIPPVSSDGDLRQRVVVVHQVDGTHEDPRVLTTLLPVDVTADGTVTTGSVLTDEAGVGWITQVLLTLVEGRPERAPAAELGRQIRRCEQLGHRVSWSTGIAREVRRVRGTDPSGG